MKALIQKLFNQSIKNADYEYSPAEIASKWIGSKPASKKEIAAIEKN